MTLGICAGCKHNHMLGKDGLCFGCRRRAAEQTTGRIVLQNTHDLAMRLRLFVAGLGIDGTVFHEQPSETGKSWSFTVVQIDASRTVPDKRRILKVRVTEESNA